MSTEHDVNPIAEPVEERITLRMQVHTDAPSHGIVLREGPSRLGSVAASRVSLGFWLWLITFKCFSTRAWSAPRWSLLS